MQRHIEPRTVAGAVTLVARRGSIAHFEAHGLMDVEAKKPMPKDGIFRLASMSKPITAVAVMMMVEEGKVRLNDPVSRFIPEFKGAKVAVPKPGARAAAARRPGGRRGGRGGAVRREFDLVSATRDITDPRSADARLRADERRARQHGRRRPQRGADRHAGHLHPEARRACRSTSSPARCGATAAWPASTCSAASSRSPRASRSISSSSSACSTRSA